MERVKIGFLGDSRCINMVLAMLHKRAAWVQAAAGAQIEPALICAQGEVVSSLVPKTCRFTKDPFEVAESSQLVSVLDASEEGKEHLELLLHALERGKHVISANQTVFATHFQHLQRQARECQQSLHVSAVLDELACAHLESKKMAVFEATNGIHVACANVANSCLCVPAGDIEIAASSELDCAKLAILASLTFEVCCTSKSVWRAQAQTLSADDFEFLGNKGLVVRDLHRIGIRRDGIIAACGPVALPAQHACARANGRRSITVLEGEETNEPFIFEHVGQSEHIKAQLLLSDLIYSTHVELVARVPRGDSVKSLLPYSLDAEEKCSILSEDQDISARYLRLVLIDEAGIFGLILGVLSDHGVSLSSLESHNQDGLNTRVVQAISRPVLWRNLRLALQKIARMPACKASPVVLRLLS